MHLLSPSDIVGPSPVTSNGTEITEIEDEASEDLHYEHTSEGERGLDQPRSEVCQNLGTHGMALITNTGCLVDSDAQYLSSRRRETAQ